MRVCVFCGSATGRGDAFVQAAKDFGRALAGAGIDLVYGGASAGTMGAVADAALAAGGRVIGVIPRQLVEREIAHHGLTESHVVADLHERKATMASLSDAFVALPGGAGTLEELFEVWTWGQLGLHHKPIGLLDVAGYFQPLLRFVDRMVSDGFLGPEYQRMLLVDADPGRLLGRFDGYVPPPHKWTGTPPPDQATPVSLPPIDALAWVHVRDGRLLVVRTEGRDAFYLPGGKRESGESDVRALGREISEELGVTLDPESMSLVTVVTDVAHGQADGRRVRMACYSARFVGLLEPGAEIGELSWLSASDADRCAPAARRVLAELHDRGLVSA